jgi:tRNA1Val (adenine37-N6)-methyltransferase
MEFGKIKGECMEDELTIELERHVYTEEYIALTKDFYLKM